MSDATDLDAENNRFWSEPCGTNAMVYLGLNPEVPDDVLKFDQWYFGIYPYLLDYLDNLDLENSRVLEVGIGLGSVSRYLAKHAKTLTCLDIAEGAIRYVQSTLTSHENVIFVSKSIFDYVPEEKFDVVIAIGSLHHTGDLEGALSRVEKMISSRGQILIMVYYAFQPRRVVYHPLRSLREFASTRNLIGKALTFLETDNELRGKADSNLQGDAAPYTEFASRLLFENRESISYRVRLRNSHRIPFLSRFLSRNFLLRFFSPYFGCDIYAIGRKKSYILEI